MGAITYACLSFIVGSVKLCYEAPVVTDFDHSNGWPGIFRKN